MQVEIWRGHIFLFQNLGPFLQNEATLAKLGPFSIQSVQNLHKIVNFNENFDKLGVKFVNLGQKR